MLAHERREELLTAWTLFIDKGIVNNNWVRNEIKESWQRCRAMNIDPALDTYPTISDDELEERRQAKRELLEIALPIMNNLFSFVEGSGFTVSLVEPDGVVLETLVDAERRLAVGKIHRFNGYILSEETAGTNAAALALRLGRPKQVFAAEHYMRSFHSLTVSAAPIFDQFGEIIGALSISGNFDKVHCHTLGMVVAAVHAIEGQLKINIANHYQSAIVETVSEGLIAVDEKARIAKINAAAAVLLKVNPEMVLQSSIEEVLGFQNPMSRSLLSGEVFIDEEFQAENPKGKTHCTITCRPIRNARQKIVGVVAIIREIRAVKQLVHKMVGARARFVFDDLVGMNPTFLKNIELAKRAANSSSNVLLLGESGTGKEVFAQAIHNASDRAQGPFIAINCGAIPRELIGSEMFGYSDGAFSGAKRGGNPGKFELAEGGTLFLDEIAEMPIELQAHLLRVLQEKVVTRIGGNQIIPVDVRVIAATNKDLYHEVAKGGFRKDLYYRLNVLTINMVPLRNRADDILPLAAFFVKNIANRLGQEPKMFHSETLDILQRYQWPGNIRELENVIERAIHLASGDFLTAECLSEELMGPRTIYAENPVPAAELPGQPAVSTKVVKINKALIIEILKLNEGNLTHVAKDLGISRPTLYRKLKKYGIRVNHGEADPTGRFRSLPFIEVADERYILEN